MASVFGFLTIDEVKIKDGVAVAIGHFDDSKKVIPVFSCAAKLLKDRPTPFEVYYEDFYKVKELLIVDCLPTDYKGPRLPKIKKNYG